MLARRSTWTYRRQFRRLAWDMPMTDHRCRVEKDRAHTLIWNVTCYTCGDRYLTDGGWYDAMGHAGMHYYDNLVPPARRLRQAVHAARRDFVALAPESNRRPKGVLPHAGGKLPD
jgi:hypothetical protein